MLAHSLGCHFVNHPIHYYDEEDSKSIEEQKPHCPLRSSKT